MIEGLRPWIDLAMAHWIRPSSAFWEAGQLQLLKIEWGPGDRFNQSLGGNRVKLRQPWWHGGNTFVTAMTYTC